MKRLLFLFAGLMCLLLTTKAAVVTFSSTNKPATWEKLKAAVGNQPIESGASVDDGSIVVFTADEGIGYHVDWYVNDVLDETAQESQLSLTITGDTKVEARYVEHFKYIFKGTPFVKYANAKGEIYVGCNAYFHRGDKARAFGYSMLSFQRSDTNQPEKPDNVPYDTLYIKKDTLKADVVMTPNWTLSESDLGDVTATVTWDFTHPDSIGLFRNFQGRCDYPSPTFMESVYTDLNMSIDATNGWIDNEHRLKLRDTQVGAGTRLKIPARYGTLYKVVTRSELLTTTIADSTTYTKTIDANGNHVATLLYYESDNDSIYININEDIELLTVSASFPGGDNVLTWEPEMKTTKNEIVTASKTGEAGCLLFNMSDIMVNGLNVEAGEPLDSLSAMIEVPDAFDESKYLSVTFQTGEGFSFSMKQIFLQLRLVGADKSAEVRMTLTDEVGNKLDTIYRYHQADSILLDTLCNLGKPNDIAFIGKMTLKVYVYGQADNYRLSMPFTCSGEICEIIRFPEGYNFIPYKAKSEIDKDGTALLTIDCFELVGVDEEEQHVILNAIEEVPMGDYLVVHSDQAGATHHIPLTRADDAYVRGNNKLWMSDGTVRGDKDIYRFGKEVIDGKDIYLFKNSSADDILPRGEVYLKYHSASRTEVFYLDKDDMPVKIEQLALKATEDNKQTIEDHKARTIKQVILDERTFTKNHAWNTLCLPFDILADNLENSPLNGAEIWELDVALKDEYAQPTGFDPETGVLTLNFKPARSIEPGKPYIFEWRTTQPSMIDNPVFENVTIKTSEPAEMCVTSSDGRVQFVGNYAPALLLGNSYGNIYMGPEDMLLIPEANMNYDAFQAYFRIDVGNGLGMPGPNYIRDCVMNIDGQFYHVNPVIVLNDTEDNSENIIDNILADVSLTGRTLFKDGMWNTMCLPFDVTTDSGPLSGDNVEVQVLDGTTSNLTDGLLTLNFVNAPEKIPAGTPFIIKWDAEGEDIIDPMFEDVIINATASTEVEFTGGKFVGTYSKFDITQDNKDEIVYLGSNNTIGYYSGSTFPKALRACRAHFYLPNTNNSRAMSRAIMNFGNGETTGIITIDGDFKSLAHEFERDGWYTVDGRRLSGRPSAKGIYIHRSANGSAQGKKIAIK